MNTKSIGLSLSGGGFKGIAHAGVLQYLKEKDITPTAISGTSAGSIVATLYASGISPEEILHLFKSVNIFNWQHFTLKKAGIMDVNTFDKYIKKAFDEKTLQDLNIPVYINATNIATGKIHFFEPSTKVVDAVLASSAFPGVFSPYLIGDELYSDGGILNNFPTKILKEKCDFVIGSNVCPIQTVPQSDLTTIRSITFRAYDLMTAMSNIVHGRICDILIEPEELTLYSTFERNKKKMDEMFAIGYQEAKKSFEKNSDIFKKAIL